jgi:hypothetical protein
MSNLETFHIRSDLDHLACTGIAERGIGFELLHHGTVCLGDSLGAQGIKDLLDLLRPFLGLAKVSLARGLDRAALRTDADQGVLVAYQYLPLNLRHVKVFQVSPWNHP